MYSVPVYLCICVFCLSLFGLVTCVLPISTDLPSNFEDVYVNAQMYSVLLQKQFCKRTVAVL